MADYVVVYCLKYPRHGVSHELRFDSEASARDWIAENQVQCIWWYLSDRRVLIDAYDPPIGIP